MCLKSKLEELRGHNVVPVMSNKLDLLLLACLQCYMGTYFLHMLNKGIVKLLNCVDDKNCPTVIYYAPLPPLLSLNCLCLNNITEKN